MCKIPTCTEIYIHIKTEALVVLGYDKSSVIKALGGIDPALDVGMIIKAALKKLAR